MNLLDLLRQQEGKTLEFKSDIPQSDGLLRTVVAFGNTAGGVILLGVKDGSREVCGVEDPVLMEERLANLIMNGVKPQLVPEVEILPWRKTHVVAVVVHLSPNRPHHVTKLGVPGGVFVRVGSTNRKVDEGLLAELERSKKPSTFDEEPMSELDSEAIDFRAVSESFASIRKLKRSDLRTLRLTAHHQGRDVPTVGGMILFGADRLRHFPDAWIQVGQFAGSDRTRILDTAEIKELPIIAIEHAMVFIRRHLTKGLLIGEGRHVEKWNVPPEAVREAVINAVVHADYSQRGSPIRVAIYEDRLEVDSPGLLPVGVTIDEILKGLSKLRNRVLGRVFHELGLIEQWGSGIQRMVVACREAGLDGPAFEELGTQFRVTLFTNQRVRPTVAEADKPIIALLAQEQGLSTQDIASKVRRSTRATRMRLIGLVSRGIVVEVGTSPNDPRRRYYLADEVRPVAGAGRAE